MEPTPDHLAAIDTLTRNSAKRAPKVAPFIGALFAGGHSIMVLAIAALVGFLGAHFAAHRLLMERIGTLISIVVLIALAIVNLRQLRARQNDRLFGIKMQLLPMQLRTGSSPWLAIPVGLLFGFGFETSSQVATYAVAFGTDVGMVGALLVGSAFCGGMICTDTLDSLFVHRIVSYRSGNLPSIMRVWIWTITCFAVAVAAYELLQLLGYTPPFSDGGGQCGTRYRTVCSLYLDVLRDQEYHSHYTANGATTMIPLRSVATVMSTALLVAVISLYTTHAARGSDHQDSPTVVARPGADITDVYVYPAPDNTANVVLAMDVYPLIPAGMATSGQYSFDPSVL